VPDELSQAPSARCLPSRADASFYGQRRTVQVYLQSKRLKIASQLPEADTLTRELQNFQVKITDAANDTYGAWREGTHADLVLAAALALWTGTEVQTWSTQHFRLV